MTGIFRFKPNQPVNWHHRSKIRSNQYCLYCSGFIGEGSEIPSDKEHLVGKRFVPPGAFDGGKKFNFHFRACKKCNREKSKLEDHISSVTLFTSPARREDGRLDKRAREKAGKSYHPSKRGVTVAESGEQIEISGGRFTFGFASPPQPNVRYRNRLALRHAQGLYALLTSYDPTRADGTRLLRPDHCWILGYYNQSDWGNAQLLEAIRRTESWRCCANVCTADGYFRAVMRQEAPGKQWFWALEWNKSARVCGSISPPGELPELFRDLPDLNWKTLAPNEQNLTRYRAEVSLSPDEDTLFDAVVDDSIEP